MNEEQILQEPQGNGVLPCVMLSCPFCGSIPELKKQGWYPKSGGVRQQTYQVRCCKCDMTDKFWSKDTEAEAVEKWNTRA
jgi:Lar family restriction alleviation protein